MARDIKKTIQGLLAKAKDSAVTREESEALMARAAELMMRYGIEQAELRQEQGRKPEDITMFTLDLPDDHGDIIVEALWPICKAFGADGVQIGPKLTLVGTVSMLDNLEMLLAALQLQMIGSANLAGDEYEKKLRKQHPSWSDDRVWDFTDRYVWDYIRGYGRGVAVKIADRRQVIIDEAPGNALVLRTEADRIKAAFKERFPNTTTARGTRYTSEEARAAGFAAGRQADIGDTRVGGNSGTKALT
ncbi:DUF2786 domain-containing protein [Actinomadura rudentiformis]|uniref:DUF2786 domain-containing protein n=1 Tax=Actinomadura rudentiformis TaxID=359158 RepID=A0A6H9YN73_9ACTN|nr:DUF2786 domain-containing protein [Actinomadura rudentiformis]KAB2344865.1 DUF2786 domain-containing protein [Actinomadura rudentiformis]